VIDALALVELPLHSEDLVDAGVRRLPTLPLLGVPLITV
jgi:hypothetical protein